MITFMKQVFKNKKKDYLFLLIILTLLASFEFCFLAMYNSLSNFDLDITSKAVLNSIPSLAIFVSMMLSIFIVKFFIDNKKQEFSILLLLGRKPKDLFIYLLIQFGILCFIAFLLGIGGGTLIMSLINYTLKNTQLSFSLNYNFLSTIFIYICFLVITIVFILTISAKQFVALDTHLSKYLSQKATAKAPYQVNFSSSSKKKIPIFSILSTILILYLTGSGLQQLMLPELSFEKLLTSFMWVLGGEIIIINTTIPMLYDLLHDSFLLKHPLLMNALSTFNEFSQAMIIFINLNAVIIPTILFLLFFSSSNILLQTIIIPCFIMIVIMIGLCLILRFSIYQESYTSSLATYYALGYSSNKLNLISLMKLSLFALFGFFIPLLFLAQLFYKAYLQSYLSAFVLIMLMLFYIFLYTGIYIYIVIRERAQQKEVTQNVKYLNRGK